MNPVPPPSSALSLFVPLCLAAFALVCLGVGIVARRRKPESIIDYTCFFLAAQALLYAVSMLPFVYARATLEDLGVWVPLLLSVVLVIVGARLRSPALWTAGLATPGLGLLFQKFWVLLPFSAGVVFVFPQDPLWFFGLAALIFAMPFSVEWRSLWEDMEPVHTAASCLYALVGFWLLASGHPSLLDLFGLPAHVWAGALAVVALLVIWVAKNLRDPILFGAGVFGLVAGVVEFLARYA